MTTRLLDLLNRRGKGLAVRLRGGVHPKHLASVEGHDWYLRHLRPEDRVLDFGCGLGFHAERAAGVAAMVWGIDKFAPVPRKVADVRLRLGQGDNLDTFCDGEFTAVMLLDVLEHIADRQRLLREIHRVLTPDGRLILSVPNSETRWRRRLRAAGLFAYSDPDHKVEYDGASLRHELLAAGFAWPALYGTWDFCEPIVYDTPLAGLIDVIGGLHLGLYAALMRWKRRVAVDHPTESTGFRLVVRKR